ncbi:hypothetical protein B1A_20205, partial [mine drainage metagenome]
MLYVLDNWVFTVNGNPSTILMLRAFTANDSEVPIDPSHIPDMLPTSNSIPALSTGYSSIPYPPYGWPIAANISLGNGNYISYCVANCTYTPSNIPGSKSNGYLPIGPMVYAGSASNVYFSSNFNNTAYILAHDSGLTTTTTYSCGSPRFPRTCTSTTTTPAT